MILTISQKHILDQLQAGVKIYRTEDNGKVKYFSRDNGIDEKVDGRILLALERHELIKFKPSKKPLGIVAYLTSKGKKHG